jgi:hypothetical protein
MSDRATLQILPAQATIAPGGRIELAVTLANKSDLVDRYRVNLTGVPTEWWEQDSLTASLFPGETKVIRLTLQPP